MIRKNPFTKVRRRRPLDFGQRIRRRTYKMLVKRGMPRREAYLTTGKTIPKKSTVRRYGRTK